MFTDQKVYAETLPIKRITCETLLKLPFLFRLHWQHLQCMWELTKTTFWMRRRPLCRCHSSTFSGFLLTCFLKWSAVWCRSDLLYIYFLTFSTSFYIYLLWPMQYAWVRFCLLFVGQCVFEADPSLPKSWWAWPELNRSKEHCPG